MLKKSIINPLILLKGFTGRYLSSGLVVRNSFRKKELIKHTKQEKKSSDEFAPRRISWYPGHIAKAEREIVSYLKKVDVVIEVRDARIPLSTTHPLVPKWVSGKPLIVAIARIDQISKSAAADWKDYYEKNPPHPNRKEVRVVFVDGKHGTGVPQLKKLILRAGNAVNARRVRRGIFPRPVRAAIIGYPNVGKSALINRLIGRKLAPSRNTPGVTRKMQWVKIGGAHKSSSPFLLPSSSPSSSPVIGVSPSPLSLSSQHSIELLDSPGIIPAKHVDQEAAMKLAICNDIAECSYDKELVAVQLLDLLLAHYRVASEPLFLRHYPYKGPFRYVDMRGICERYRCRAYQMKGYEIVQHLAHSLYHGSLPDASQRVLSDFRKGLLGKCSLEAPPLPPSSLVIREPSQPTTTTATTTPSSPSTNSTNATSHSSSSSSSPLQYLSQSGVTLASEVMGRGMREGEYMEEREYEYQGGGKGIDEEEDRKFELREEELEAEEGEEGEEEDVEEEEHMLELEQTENFEDPLLSDMSANKKKGKVGKGKYDGW